MQHNELVFAVGPAGTGKTYLAAAYGAHLLHERRVERLILARPALEAGERLGFLPGDLKEKIDPYLRPLYDALFEVMGDKCVKLMESGVIEVAPLAFMRGRTLSHAFVILDEAQENCTSGQMKMCSTRLGEDSRMVVTGDPSQSDLPAGPQGLQEAMTYLAGVESVAFARFSSADVVRHALVQRIVSAYDAHEGKAPKHGRARTGRAGMMPEKSPARIVITVQEKAWRREGEALKLMRRAAGLAAATPPLEGRAKSRPQLTILLADDAYLAGLNGRFRRKSGPTNVLSFPAPSGPESETGAEAYLGDIAITYGVVAREAREQGKDFAAHAAHLAAHGDFCICWAMTTKKSAAARQMEALEIALLARLGLADPYAYRGKAA